MSGFSRLVLVDGCLRVSNRTEQDEGRRWLSFFGVVRSREEENVEGGRRRQVFGKESEGEKRKGEHNAAGKRIEEAAKWDHRFCGVAAVQ